MRIRADGLALSVALIATAAAVRPPAAVAQEPTDGLSAFAIAKAETLLRSRLPCLGCHTLDGEGGRIGPGLSQVGSRHTPERIAQILAEPRSVFSVTIMPPVPMPESWRTLIVSYLAQRRGAGPPPEEEPLPTSPAPSPGGLNDLEGAELYMRSCAPCHGTSGQGDGFNAEFLPVPPTAHADSATMSRRSDDTLFDAIYAGGYVMNRSHRMPPFGGALTREQIWSLVRHIRTLCACQGPAWSRDGTRR